MLSPARAARPVLLMAFTIVVGLLAASPALAGTSQTITHNVPGTYSWTVPPGVAQVEVIALGATGGSAASGSCSPGAGGDVEATVPVTPGEELRLMVGGAGGSASGGTPGAAGVNGGAQGGKAGAGSGGGGGGGWSGVSRGPDPLVVAGGGGGCGAGGGNGGDDEEDGSDGSSPSHSMPQGGGAGTRTGPGAGGISDDGFDGGNEGAALLGGAGFGADFDAGGGGGGGGGFFGGGGGGGFQSGGVTAGGGGGGSDFVVPAATGVTVAHGTNLGGGAVAVTYALPGTTVGEAPQGGGRILLSSGGGVWLQVASSADAYVVPTDGVVTAWRYASAGVATSGLRLVVARGAPPPENELELLNATGSFAVVGRDPALASGAITQPAGEVDLYPARLPVRAGDLIGAEWSSGMSVTKTDTHFEDMALPGDLSVDGGTITMPYGAKLEEVDEEIGFGPGPTGYAGLKMPISVQVEPDADGDGWGDLSQDRCLAAAGSLEGCRVADLGISQMVAATSPWPQATFTQVVTNAGPDAVADATVTEALPAGATAVSAGVTTGSCAVGATVTCHLGPLAPGASATISLVVRPAAPGPLGVTATVASQTLAAAAASLPGAGDPDPGDDTATADTIVAAPPTGGPPAGASGPGPGASASRPGAAAAPKITHLRQSAARWREGRKVAKAAKGRRPRVPTGTTFRFALNEQASVNMTFTRRIRRRDPQRRCTAPRARRGHPACVFTQTLGAKHIDAKAGTNAVPFTGRLDSGRRLPSGRISVTFYARDTAGRRAAPRSLTFTIVK